MSPVSRGLASALVCVSALLLCCFCGEKESPQKGASARMADPVPAPTPAEKKPARPIAEPVTREGQKAGVEELFTIQVVGFWGTVTTRANATADKHPAVNNEELFGGGFIETSTDGKAEVNIRGVGNADLAPSTRLYVPTHGRCGAVLVQGAAYLEGPARAMPTCGCFLHTPAPSVCTPREKVLVAVGQDGSVRVGAPAGAVTYVTTGDESVQLAAGQEIGFGPDGKAGEASPLRVADQRTIRDTYNGFRKETELKEDQKKGAVAQALDRAEQAASALEANVARLLELMAKNQGAMEEKRALTAEADKNPDKAREGLRALTQKLGGQVREMTERQVKGLHQIHRLHGAVDYALLHAGDDQKAKKRVVDLLARTVSMNNQLPDLFKRQEKLALMPRKPTRVKKVPTVPPPR